MSISKIFRKRLAKSLGRAHRGMTLLEIMIVLAILALVMGLVVGPRVMKAFSQSKNDIAKLTTKKFATEAYPLWLTSHAGKSCPDKIDDLYELADSKDGKEPVGHALHDGLRPRRAGRRQGLACSAPART